MGEQLLTYFQDRLRLLDEAEEDDSEVMEILEDAYHLDLTEFYGSPDGRTELFELLRKM